MKILVTGFDPFGGQTVNPAYEAVRLLPDQIGAATLIKAQIPTIFGQGADLLEQLMEAHTPDAVLLVGQAGGRAAISVERIAINVQDASIADNAGAQPVDLPVVPGGPAAYFATIPVKKIVRRVQEAGIPCRVSDSAGTFVCNDLMYRMLHHIDVHHLPVIGGFIHVPYLPQQAAVLPGQAPSMSLEMIVQALHLALKEILASFDTLPIL
ncbi:MAG: pyroglutamyl-peptidase I [Clostridiales bacterium]|nr:pyroglutamyl-peptidase I [Clostridiales bacterium]